ncbi:MAG: aspartate aminotransferase family protein [Theionarchaea archaeon]|nr:aspartate aminotransferase family protein [Theionarchaea archaeon]
MGSSSIYSGASPEKVAEDLQPLVDFQDAGLSPDELESLVEERLIPHLMKYDSPGFQSMFNILPEKGAKYGGYITLKYNQGVTNWQVSPGGAVLEELCCRKLIDLLGLCPAGDGTFMYSGTYANQEAVYLALHWKAEKDGFNLGEKGLMGFPDPRALAVAVSTDAHFSMRHAVRMLGLGEESLISVPVDKNRRMDSGVLEDSVDATEKEIVCVVATAGTTATGSVDNIPPIAEICKKAGAWLHVDGAYGLAYKLVPEWSSLFAGVELADSVSWDPHKQMGIPIPNSLLFVRRKEDFERMSIHSHYFNREEDVGPNPGLKSPPSTRPMSALSMVTSIRYQGLKKVVERLRSPLIAVRDAYETIREDPDIEVCHYPDTGILCFRIAPPDIPRDQLNQLQMYIYTRITQEGQRYISVTRLEDTTVLRLVALSPQVTCEALLETVAAVRDVAGEYQFMY